MIYVNTNTPPSPYQPHFLTSEFFRTAPCYSRRMNAHFANSQNTPYADPLFGRTNTKDVSEPGTPPSTLDELTFAMTSLLDYHLTRIETLLSPRFHEPNSYD